MLDLASTQEYHIPDLRTLLITTENTELLLSPCVLAFVPLLSCLTWCYPSVIRSYYVCVMLAETHPPHSSDTGRGISRRCPGLQRSQPGPGCTGACCSRPVVPPPRHLTLLPPHRTLSLRLHGCWRSASSSWRNHHRRPRWKADLWQTPWHRRQALSWRPCCFWAFDKANKGERVERLLGWRAGGTEPACEKNSAQRHKFESILGSTASGLWQSL